MNLEARKYKFIQQLSEVNETLLEKLEYVLKQDIENSKRISLEQYNTEIDDAISDIQKGEFHTNKKAQEIANKW